MSEKQLSVADQRKNFLGVIQGDGFKKQMALALPKHVTPDRMLRVAVTAMNKTPDLYDCDQTSVMACLMDCSALGLEPDGRNAYLIPFNDKRRGKICQLIVGYQGFIDLGYRHPLVRGIRAKAVYEKDHFVYDEGLNPRLEHTPYDGSDDPGLLKYAYAICNIGDAGNTFVVLNRRQILKAKSYSRGADSQYSPWKTNEEAMWIKTAVRALAKFMPRSTELSQALSVDDEHTGAIDVSSTVIPTGNVGQKQLVEHVTTPMEEATGEPSTETAKAPSPEKLIKQIVAKGAEISTGKARIVTELVALNYLKEGETLDNLTAEQAADVLANWSDIKERIVS